MKKPKPIIGFPGAGSWLAVLVFIDVLLLTAVVGSWWTGRNNTLFGNGRWVAGKDTGKYVFYSYDFMFAPLDSGRIDLAGHMGFQEILYRQADGPHRRLTSVSSEIHVGENGYLWVEINKKGNSFLGIRISRRKGYPGGFYLFDQRGEITGRKAFNVEPSSFGDGWRRLEVRLDDGAWHASLGGVYLGSQPAPAESEGRFGLRGSGAVNTPVMARDIVMDFDDPADPGRTWTESEDFVPGVRSFGMWFTVLLFSTAAVTLRLSGRVVFGRFLDEKGRRAYYTADALFLASILVFLLFYGVPSPGVLIPAAFVVAEGGSLFFAGRFGGRKGPAAYGTVMPGQILGIALTGLAVASLGIHGGRIGRAMPEGPSMLRRVHPSAYTHHPGAERSSKPLKVDGPVRIRPGKPFFCGEGAYDEQEIIVDFTMPPDCTMDVVFQQQSFRVKGDPDGEEIPYQRSLVRLTTARKVDSGLALSSGNRPAPFSRLPGLVLAGEVNHLEIRSGSGGMTIAINGEEKNYPGSGSLGYGETGFMVYDRDAVLDKLEVRPAAAEMIKNRALPWAGLIIPLFLAAVAWLVLRPGSSLSFLEAASLEFAALYPLGIYMLGTLFLSGESLSFMGRERMAWLDLLAAASILAHLVVVLLLRGRINRPALLYNILLACFLAAAALLAWDMLPSNHALRLMLTREADAPARPRRRKKRKNAPWYSDMHAIGANIYTWKQRFGGEEVPVPKPDGEYRIILVGGSQAWGSGAASSRETFAEILEERLKDRGLPVEIYNAGVNGAGIIKIADTYRGLLNQFEPDLIIADVGLNDSAALASSKGKSRERNRTILASYLEELVLSCRRDGVDIVLVKEPMCRETPLRPSRSFYASIDRLGTDMSVPVIDPSDVIERKEKDHLVWWDTAHFAPYGHSLMAGLLVEEVEKAVRKGMVNHAPR